MVAACDHSAARLRLTAARQSSESCIFEFAQVLAMLCNCLRLGKRDPGMIGYVISHSVKHVHTRDATGDAG